MLRTTLPMRTALSGVVSPFLCVRNPSVLNDVLHKGRTKENIDVVAREVFSQHRIAKHEVFPETKKLVEAVAQFDRKAYSEYISTFVNERKTDREIFAEFLKNASPDQIKHALKVACSNNDLNSIEIILPYAKDRQKTLDELFMQLRNKKDMPIDIIHKFLPLCSENVQSRYLKEMIIQKNKAAVSEIISFYKPTDEHKKLAKTHFSSAILIKLFKKGYETVRDRVESYTGMINVSLVDEMKSSVKQTGKQLVESARETTKLVLRKMGILAGPSELVIRGETNNLENLNGVVFGRSDPSYSNNDERLGLSSGISLLKGAGLSIVQSMKNAMLEGSLVPRLEEKVKIALPSGSLFIADELDEESDHFYTLPKVRTNTSEEDRKGYAQDVARGFALAGAFAVAGTDDPRNEEEEQPPVEASQATVSVKEIKSPEETKPDSEIIAGESSSLAQSDQGVAKQSKTVIKEFSDEYILGPSDSWAGILNQMKRDELMGVGFRNYIPGYTP